MGLLDDAIREHLELKRRRGADPDEVARQEDEALGDPRSGEFARTDAAPPEGAVEPIPEEPEAEPEEPLTPVEPDEAPPAPIEPDDPPAAYAAPSPAEEPWLEDERIEAPAAEPTPSEAEPPADAPPPASADEDVLEETPDFLQETPEHDRLWFEQKPPRDFDFDS